MKPFVKWAGGKRQILSKIKKLIDEAIDDNKLSDYTYIEPFLGGGAVFFSVRPKTAIINDLNGDLINAYRVLQSCDYEQLIAKLKVHNKKYLDCPDDYYYEIRHQDRNDDFKNMSAVDRAARMIFLNRTCYNGLYRVNNCGYFNTPIGRYNNPLICDEQNLMEIHDYLSTSQNNIEILNESYEAAFNKAQDGDIIYVDPPYDYEDDDGFTKYQMNGFSFDDFIKLKDVCDQAINNGATVIISNNATDKVLELFKQDPNYEIFYDYEEFKTLRTINCKAAERRSGREIIILGMAIDLPQANNLDSIVKLAQNCTVDDYINDREKIKKDLNIRADRQVAYYLSALMYFQYLNRKKEVLLRIKELNGDAEKIKLDIFQQLKARRQFNELYFQCKHNNKISIAACKKIVSQGTKRLLSDTALDRRASTIRSWIEWMLQYAAKHNLE